MIFRATGRSHEEGGDAEDYQESHTWGNLPGYASGSKLSQRARTVEKKMLNF